MSDNKITSFFTHLSKINILVRYSIKVNEFTRLKTNLKHITGLRSVGNYLYTIVSATDLNKYYVEMEREEDCPYDEDNMWVIRKFAPSDVLTEITRDPKDIEVITRLFPGMVGPKPVFGDDDN